MRGRHPGARGSEYGFTLIELMLSAAVLTLLLVITFGIIDSVSAVQRRTRSRIDTFQEARAGFESVTRRLSQAMLNTYWDYEYPLDSAGKPDLTQPPKGYVRQSELHFVCGPTKTGTSPLLPDAAIQSSGHSLFFQAPLGVSSPSSTVPGPTLQNLLNTNGYFLEFTSDKDDLPKFLQSGGITERWRSRLMEFCQPTENLMVYRITTPIKGSTYQALDWFREPLKAVTKRDVCRALAENIVALVFWPHRSPHDPAPAGAPAELAPKYLFDSRKYISSPTDPHAKLTRNQLPPMVQVTMVAIDEVSALRLQSALPSPESLPYDKLTVTNLFQQPSSTANPSAGQEGDTYRSNLQSLENELNRQRITYRVFSTDVSIQQAKWSEN